MDALAGIAVSSGSMPTLRLTPHSRSRCSHHDSDLCFVAQSPNQSQTVIYPRAPFLPWLTTPIKLEYDGQSTREEFSGLTIQASRLTPLPKIAFSVQTGLLTSLCAIIAITCVSHHLLRHMQCFLTRNDTDPRLTRHLHIWIFLFLTGSTYVRIRHMVMDSCSF